MTPDQPIVYGYVRVSSRGQADHDGPRRQKDAIAKFCRLHGLDLENTWEEAISGTVDGMDRPRFSDMLEEAHDDGVTAIVVENMDRLARDLMVSEILLAECRKRGIKVYSADQAMPMDIAADGGDPTRTLIRQFMGALAQYVKASLVYRMSAARQKIREKTGRCGGEKPYGQLPGEALVLKAMVAYRREGHTYLSIAKHLNADRMRTRYGSLWTVGSVGKILHRELKEENEHISHANLRRVA